MANDPTTPSDLDNFTKMVTGKTTMMNLNKGSLPAIWQKLYPGAISGVLLSNSKDSIQTGRCGTFLFDGQGVFLGACFYDA